MFLDIQFSDFILVFYKPSKSAIKQIIIDRLSKSVCHFICRMNEVYERCTHHIFIFLGALLLQRQTSMKKVSHTVKARIKTEDIVQPHTQMLCGGSL